MDRINGFKAFEVYGKTEEEVAAAVARGDVSIVTHKKGGQRLTLKVKDEARNVDSEVPFESLKSNNDAGDLFLAGDANAVHEATTYACDLYARAKARGDFLEAYGTKDKAAEFAKAVKSLMALTGVSEDAAKAMVAAAQAKAQEDASKA